MVQGNILQKPWGSLIAQKILNSYQDINNSKDSITKMQITPKSLWAQDSITCYASQFRAVGLGTIPFSWHFLRKPINSLLSPDDKMVLLKRLGKTWATILPEWFFLQSNFKGGLLLRPSNMTPSSFLIKPRVVLPSGPICCRLGLCDPIVNELLRGREA